MDERGPWTGNRIVLTIIAAATVVLGLVWIGRGLITLQDLPRRPDRVFGRYVMSGQVEDIGGGFIAIVFGVSVYRYGLKR